MGLESLQEIAFMQGCGILRSAALKKPRFQELVVQAPRIPFVQRREVAEMLFLGEQLADNGFARLPYRLRKHAWQWQDYTHEEKIRALKDFVTIISKRVSTEQDRKQPQHVLEVLPQERGSWGRGKMRPNCLGVAQMLIGFARATGSEHFLVDTLYRRDQFMAYQTRRIIDRLLQRLESYKDEPTPRNICRKLRSYRRDNLKAIEDLESRHQAHHALAIKVDDKWILLDPYMKLSSPLEMTSSDWTMVSSRLTARPSRAVTLVGGDLERMHIAGMLGAFDEALSLYLRQHEPVEELTLSKMFISILSEMFAVADDGKNKKLDSKVIHELGYVLAVSAMTPPHRWSRANDDIAKNDLETYGTNITRRNWAIKRMLLLVALYCIDQPYVEMQKPDGVHPLIEVLHPTYHLAVMTVSQLGHIMGKSTADLIRFDNSQWILHDTLEEVTQSGTRRQRQVMAIRLRRINKHEPRFIMPALRWHLNERNTRDTQQENG